MPLKPILFQHHMQSVTSF